jgi:hypothetical protein
MQFCTQRESSATAVMVLQDCWDNLNFKRKFRVDLTFLLPTALLTLANVNHTIHFQACLIWCISPFKSSRSLYGRRNNSASELAKARIGDARSVLIFSDKTLTKCITKQNDLHYLQKVVCVCAKNTE